MKRLKKVPTADPCSMWDEPEECLQPQHQRCNNRGLWSWAGQGNFGHYSSQQRKRQRWEITRWKYQLTLPVPDSPTHNVIKQRSSLPEGHCGCHKAGWIPSAPRWTGKKKSTTSKEHRAADAALAIPQLYTPGLFAKGEKQEVPLRERGREKQSPEPGKAEGEHSKETCHHPDYHFENVLWEKVPVTRTSR